MYVMQEEIGGITKIPNSKNIDEENRRKKVQEYKKLIDDVTKVTSKISEFSDELISIEKMLNKCITGEFANSIKNIIQSAQEENEKVMNDLNVIGTKAAQKVEREGEPCTYNKKQSNSKLLYKPNRKTTFSCNTDVLKQVLPRLQNLKKGLESTVSSASKLPKLEGCEDVTNIPNQLNGIIKSAIIAPYIAIENMIERAEQAEAETERMAEQIGRENIDAITGAFRRPPETPNYDFAKVCKIAMEKGIQFKSGEKPSEFIRRVAEELNIPTTILQEGIFGESPVIDQLKYDDIKYGRGNIKSGGCGACAYYSLGTAEGKEVMDERGFLQKCSDLLKKYFPNYTGGGTPAELFQNEEFLALSGLEFVRSYAWGGAFNDDCLDEDLEKGYRVVCQTTDKVFAVSGHYMSIVGKTEDGKYILRDSDSVNWPKYQEEYEHGFSLEFLKAHINGSFYAFSVEPTETTKDDDTLVKEILETSGYKSQNETEKPRQVNVPEPTIEPVTEPKTTTSSEDKKNRMKDTLIQKFSKAISYAIDKIKRQGYIGSYYIAVPDTINTENKPENMLIYLHGNGGTDGEIMIDAINTSDLQRPNAITIGPVVGKSTNPWCGPVVEEELKEIIVEVLEKYDLEREDITITLTGCSGGGQGVVYLAASEILEDYIDNVIVMDGCNSIVSPADVKKPIIGYSGSESHELHVKYMEEMANQIGEENVIKVESSHEELPKNAYNIDENNNGISDMLEWAFSQNGEVEEVKEVDPAREAE